MRICCIADGMSIHTQRWVKYFAEKGHEVHLISPRPLGNSNIGDVKLHILRKIRSQVRIVSGMINLLLYVIQTRRLLKRVKPDILHAHCVTDNGWLGALTGFHPFVISVWGSDVLSAPYESIIIKQAVNFALGKADMVAAQSQLMGDYLKAEFGVSATRFAKIPWGIDLEVFRHDYYADVVCIKKELGINNNSPVILSNRSMAPQYEIASIVDSIPNVLRKVPNAIFVFLYGYGNERFESEMKSRVIKLGVDKNTRFVPNLISPEEVAAYLNMSKAFVSIPRYGQFGMSVFEGMACGSAPVLSDIAIHEEFVADSENGFLVDPNNPKGIAVGITNCIENPEQMNRWKQTNRAIVEQEADWNKNAQIMEELYKSMLC